MTRWEKVKNFIVESGKALKPWFAYSMLIVALYVILANDYGTLVIGDFFDTYFFIGIFTFFVIAIHNALSEKEVQRKEQEQRIKILFEVKHGIISKEEINLAAKELEDFNERVSKMVDKAMDS
jgi:hypothetical protein